MWEKITKNFSKILDKMPVKEFILSKVAGLHTAILKKMNSFTGIFQGFCQLNRNTYFLWTAASEFLLKGISEHPVISFIPYFHSLKPRNEINKNRILMHR